jgi:CHAT domain
VSAYRNFDLEIGKLGDQYRSRVIDPDAGNGRECQFTWTTLQADLDDLLTCLHVATRNRRSVVPVLEPSVAQDANRHLAVLTGARLTARKKLREFGAQLFDRVFTGPVREALRRSANEARKQKQGLRVRLRLDNLPEFQDVPWEYLYDTEAPGEFMLHSQDWSLVRNLPLPNPVPVLPLEQELRVLVLISSPNDVTKLNVEQEWLNLEREIKTSLSGQIVLERLPNASLKALHARLLQQSFHAIHFIGHGGFDGDEGVLLLEDDDVPGRSRAVRADQLGAILRNFNTLRLVVLNACEGARTSSRDPFAGVAQRLIGLDIPAVVAMQYEISDKAAIIFSSMFYAALVRGYPVDAAMTQARVSIFANADAEFEFGVPVLHMRLEDGQLFSLPSQKPTAEPATEPATEPDDEWIQLTGVDKIPNGPKVDLLWFSRDLIKVFSDQAGDRILATQLLNAANAMVAKAVPVEDQKRLIITPGQTPGFHQPDSFWTEVLYMAAAKGPKLTAALILCLPIDAFLPSTLKLRQRLLESLMANTAHVFTPD